MDSGVKLYVERAENELRLAKAVFNLSKNERFKIELEANPDDTFYSAVISHSYYSIFYCAKAYLFFKNIKFPEQGQHQAVYYQFRKFVIKGVIGKELLKIYNDLIVKADELLNLFEHEKSKRGHFVYKTTAQANVEPAQESINNTIKFLSNIKAIIENEK
jgi:uncharacterized protein (UPF0332 family)